MAKPHDMSDEEWLLRKEFNDCSLMAYHAWQRVDELKESLGNEDLIEAYEVTGKVMQERMWTVFKDLTEKYAWRSVVSS